MSKKDSCVEFRETEDGSATLYHAVIGECYHSVHGAQQESRHIFIEAALHHVVLNKVRVFEVGFGTGLNALLTLQDAQQRDYHVTYHTIELYPLHTDVYEKLNYASAEHQLSFINLHACEWNKEVSVNSSFTFKKIQDSILNHQFTELYDVIFFDAFSPEKQPELWSDAVFQKMYDGLRSGGVLTTYCAKGDVRRSMMRAGFIVERLPGPPGKRHILRAVKP